MFGFIWKIIKVCIGLSFLFGIFTFFSVFYASNEVQKHQEELSSNVKEGWSVVERSNKMDDSRKVRYSIKSRNTVNFKFPYSGKQRGQLTVRKSGNKLQDAFFSIQKGQMMCVLGCEARVRFGERSPVKYSLVGPSDQSTETVFFENHKAFIKNLKSVNSVFIEVTVYNEGQQVFEFGWDEVTF